MQVAQGRAPPWLSLAAEAAWRFLYRLPSRLQTMEPLAVVVVVVEVVAYTPPFQHHHIISRLITAAEAAEAAEQEPLTLQVELVAPAHSAARTAGRAVLAQADLLALVAAQWRGRVVVAAVGVQQEPPAPTAASHLGKLEVQLAQPSQAIQTLLITPLAHV